jgi:hypothetical protein
MKNLSTTKISLTRDVKEERHELRNIHVATGGQ